MNCLAFPYWVDTHEDDEIREELLRIMDVGKKFKSFNFCLWDIDPRLGEEKIFSFHDIFCQCAEKAS